MRAPLFVRELSEAERGSLWRGLQSRDAFTLRRSQILLRSADGERSRAIARELSCTVHTVCDAITAFHREGLACLSRKRAGPKEHPCALDAPAQERLRDLCRQSPRAFGRERTTWTLHLLADVCFEEGITDHRVSHEAIRQALLRLGLRFQRAKDWIISPDPAYGRKKGDVTG